MTAAPTTNGHDFHFDNMDEALAAFKDGQFLVVMDDESRENEGDLIIAASKVTTQQMAWMIKHTSGFICVALPEENLNALEVPMMLPGLNQDPHRTAYAVTIDYKHGTTTGISAHDRALTARSLASSKTTPSDITRPGHIVPLRAAAGGTAVRRGHTESAVDLCILSGLTKPEQDGVPAGVLCELVEDNEDGSMMRRDGCRAFADKHGIKMISVEMIAELRRKLDGLS